MSEIIKVKKTKNFSVICNEIYQNKEISARAKGLHTYLMTLPDDWKVNRLEVFTHFSEGRDAMNKAFKELETFGYIIVNKIRTAGRFDTIEYQIFESITGNGKPVTGNPSTVNPAPENPQLLNTDQQSTNKQSTNNSNKKTPKAKKHKHGEFKNVLLSDEEFMKLDREWGVEELERMIGILDEGIELKGYKYKSHYLALRKWKSRETPVSREETEEEKTARLFREHAEKIEREKVV